MTVASYLPDKSQECNKRDNNALDGMILRPIKHKPDAPMNLLRLPSSVLDNIMDYLYHKEDIYLCDRPTPCSLQGLPNQTNYKTADGSRTTYKAYLRGCTLEGLSKRAEFKAQLNLCVSLLSVNQKCFDLAVKHVYDRTFHFRQSAESCLAFLHDHHREPYQVSNLALRYVLTDGAVTRPGIWRRLFNVLVHEREDLRELRLNIGSEFWRLAPWEEGAQTVYNWKWPPRSPREDETQTKRENFIQHVARLSDVKVTLYCETVSGPKQGEKMFFLGALKQHVLLQMEKRDRLTEAKKTTCQEKRLEYCCYYKGKGSDV